MSHARWWLVCLGCVLVFAACAPTTTGTPTQSRSPGAAHATASSAPSATPLPMIRPGDPIGACTLDPSQGPYYRIGGELIASTPRFVFAYPAYPMQDGEPLNPYQLNDAAGDGNFTQTIPVNPAIQQVGAGYGFFLCNTSASASHVVSTFLARIVSFTPYTGQLNAWQPCDGSYSRTRGVVKPECGGTQAFAAYV